MSFADAFTLFLAAWGGISGTIALYLQWAQHRVDRAILELKGSMGISSNISDPVERYYFQLDVVNRGRRVARIAEVYVETTEVAPGARWMLYDSKGKDPISLEEGGTTRFEDRVMTTTFDKLFESFADQEHFYVRLTTGEIHKCRFATAKKSILASLRQK